MPKIEIRSEGLVEEIARVLGAKKLWFERLGRTATAFGEYASTYAQKRHRTGGTTESRTRVRTGRLRRAYRYLVSIAENAVEILLGIVRPEDEAEVGVIAAVHERGAIITPKKGKYLAIPLDAALTAAGVPRGGPRDFDDTFVLRKPGRNPVIMQKRPGNEVVPLFALVKKVVIPDTRKSLVPTYEKLGPRLEAQALNDLREAIGGRLAA